MFKQLLLASTVIGSGLYAIDAACMEELAQNFELRPVTSRKAVRCKRYLAAGVGGMVMGGVATALNYHRVFEDELRQPKKMLAEGGVGFLAGSFTGLAALGIVNTHPLDLLAGTLSIGFDVLLAVLSGSSANNYHHVTYQVNVPSETNPNQVKHGGHLYTEELFEWLESDLEYLRSRLQKLNRSQKNLSLVHQTVQPIFKNARKVMDKLEGYYSGTHLFEMESDTQLSRVAEFRKKYSAAQNSYDEFLFKEEEPACAGGKSGKLIPGPFGGYEV